MSQTVRDSKYLARYLRRAAQQSAKIKTGQSVKVSADQIAKDLLPKLQARGLVS